MPMPSQYQLPMNPAQVQMLMGAMSNPTRYQQLLQQFSLMNTTSPAGYFQAMESQLPSYLQLGSGVGDQAAATARQRFMSETGKPAIGAARTNEMRRGGPGNSFATAQTAQTRAAMNLQASRAAEEAKNNELQRIMAMRQSFFGMPQSMPLPSFSEPMSGEKTFGSPGSPSTAAPTSGGMFGGSGGGFFPMAQQIDGFLGGALSNAASTAGANLGVAVNNLLTSKANPLAGLFGG